MPATPLARSQRFYRPETTQFAIVDTFADYTDPLRAELDAGTEVSGEIGEVSGFQVTSETIDVPDFGSKFVGKIGGPTTADDSTFSVYQNLDSSTGSDLRDVVSRGDVTHVVIYDSGDVESNLMDVYPVQVTAIGKTRARGDAAMLETQFAVTDEPAEDVTVPAHV